MAIVDITTLANYFGRVTGIARVEHQIASQMRRHHPDDTRFVFWSNAKNRFVPYFGPLDFAAVKAARRKADADAWAAGSRPDPTCDEIIDTQTAFVATGGRWLKSQQYALGCVAFARAHRMAASILVHDLIPAKFPRYYDTGEVRLFEENLRLFVEAGFVLPCNSRNTERDLLDWCAAKGLPTPRTGTVRLGAGFPAPTAAEAQAERPRDLPEGRFVLAVGAIHRRKNYELLAAVWRRLAAQTGPDCPLLVIVGGVARDGQPLAEEMQADPVLRDRIRILSDVDDAHLARLYAASLLVVYPSRYEGWGLPVTEALSHGKVCLASRVASIPEIANLGADLMGPDKVSVWTDRILGYIRSPQALTSREAQLARLWQPTCWRETAETVLALTLSAATATVPAPTLRPGDIVDWSIVGSARFVTSACHGIEPWGRWADGREIVLRFASIGRKSLILSADLRFLSDGHVMAVINGRTVARAAIPSGEVDLRIVLDRENLAGENDLRLVSDHLDRLPDTSPKRGASRRTGLGLRRVTIAAPAEERDSSPRGPGPEDSVSVISQHRELLEIRQGRLEADGLHAENGVVALAIGGIRAPSGGIACGLALRPGSDADLRLNVLQNGRLLWALPVTLDGGGTARVVLALDARGSGELDLRVTLCPADGGTGPGFTILDLTLPAGSFDTVRPPSALLPQFRA